MSVIFCACKSEDKSENNKTLSYGVYTVKFESSGGSFVSDVLSDSASGRIQEPQNPVKDNYDFAGWYTSADYKSLFDFNDTVNSDLTLYAKWKPLFTIINFYGNGSTSGAMASVEGDFGEVISLPENNFNRTGYTFVGWSLKSTGSVQNKDKGYYYVPEDSKEVTVLYACWKPNAYNVYFDTQGSDSYCEVIPAIFGEYLASFKKPYKAGYKFNGFFTDKEGRGICYYDNSMCAVNVYSIAADATLYAYWTPDIKTIMFDANCNTYLGAVDSLTSKTLQTVNMPENSFKREGYIFKEWNSKSDGTGQRYVANDEFFVCESEEDFRIFAIWEPVNYNVIFVDGKGNSIQQTHIYDCATKLYENCFEKRGHSFLGWSKSEYGNIEYCNGEEVCNLLNESNASLTLYAVWQANTYQITLDTQGGLGGSDYVSVVYGQEFPKTMPPKKFGYIFNGYFSSINGKGTKYLDRNMYAVEVSDLAEDSSVYAYWTPKSINIYFADNGSTSGTVEALKSGSMLEVVLPECKYYKVGYSFVGWNEKSDGSGESYSENAAFVTPVTESDLYLYPVWEAKSVTILFDGNDCTGGATGSVIGYSDKELDLPDCGFAKRGYDFVGWGTSSNSNEVVSDIYNVPASDEDLVLYAIWDIHKYKINYVLNGSENPSRNPQDYTVLDSTIYLNEPKYAGYSFEGWKDKDNNKIASIPAGSIGDLTFIAEWKKIVYKITYILGKDGINHVDNPNEYTVENQIILKDPTNKANDKFEGWSEGNTIFKGSIGDKTFTAEWGETRYKIIYNLHGGINGSGNPGSYVYDSDDIILNDPMRIGYTFNGWVDESGNSVTGEVLHHSSGDKYFEARWTIITYSINYVMNGGTNSPVNPYSYTVEDMIELENPTFSGYIFDGWSEGNVILEGTTGNKTFTANWRKTQYSILYVLGEDASNAPENPSEYFVDSEDINIQAPTRKHYNFIGWRTESQEQGEIYASYVIKSGSAQNIILFAVWEAIEYEVNYVLNGGINSIENLAYVTFETKIELKDPTKTGYKFTGWTVDGEIITELLKIEGPITLTATWEIIEYTITYNLVVDAIHNNPDKYTVEDNLVLSEPTIEGYKFLYWTDEEGNLVESIPVGTSGDIILTAHWELIEVIPPEPEPKPEPDENIQ